MGRGQLRAADLLLVPAVVFTETDVGGLSGLFVGRLPGKAGQAFSAMSSGLKVKKVEVNVVIIDVRQGVQVDAAEATVTHADIGVNGWGIASRDLAGFGAYGTTPEGQVVASAFAGALQKVVRAAQSNPAYSRLATSPASVIAFAPGDVVVAKINGVPLLATPSDTQPPVALLREGEPLVYLGDHKAGYAHVQSPMGEGWVREILITMR